MDLSSLPAFPTPEPPAPTSPPAPPSRTATMLAQLAFAVVLSGLIYALHQQAEAIVEAEENTAAREKEAAAFKHSIVGQWSSEGSYKTRLTFAEDGEFWLLCFQRHAMSIKGKYEEDKDNGILTLHNAQTQTTHRYRVTAYALEIWDLPLGYFICDTPSNAEGYLRFWR